MELNHNKMHKVAKGETLAKIAQKYKVKRWRDIWDEPKNAKLRSKRKRPERIEPADVIFLPLSEKQKTEIQGARLGLAARIRIEQALALIHAGRADQLEAQAKRLRTETVKRSDAIYYAMIASLEKTARGAKNWGDGVDLAATVLLLAKGARDLSKSANTFVKEEAKLLGKNTADAKKALHALRAQFKKDAVGFAFGPANGIAQAAASQSVLENAHKHSKVVVAGAVIVDSWNKIQSPSFWAWTVVRLWEGDGWSDAVTYDFQEEVRNKIAIIKTERLKARGRIIRDAEELEKAAATLRAEAKAANARKVIAEKLLKIAPKI